MSQSLIGLYIHQCNIIIPQNAHGHRTQQKPAEDTEHGPLKCIQYILQSMYWPSIQPFSCYIWLWESWMMTNMTEFAASTGVVSKSPQFLSSTATFTAACFDLCERHMLFFLKKQFGAFTISFDGIWSSKTLQLLLRPNIRSCNEARCPDKWQQISL